MGDVDGDSLDDLLIGAYGNDDGGTTAGKAYLLFGSSLGTSADIELSSADYTFTGEAAQDTAGWRVSGAGDVDGDDLDDLLIGANYNDNGGANAGAAYLVLATSLGSTTSMGVWPLPRRLLLPPWVAVAAMA